MLLCKQEKAWIHLSAEQVDWRDDNDDEPGNQEFEAHYMYMAHIQEVSPDVAANSGPVYDSEPLQKLVEIILFILNSGCSKHMTRNLKLLCNLVEKLLGTVKFGNDQIALILGYGDLVQGNITIKRGNDLLTSSHGSNLYSITLQDIISLKPICLMAEATSSQAWLWHRRLSHLNFDSINLLSKNDYVVGLLKFSEGVVISCFCVHLSPIAYPLSHGGTMAMSLMHQWHDIICGGVIGPRGSILYGAYGFILVSSEKSLPSQRNKYMLLSSLSSGSTFTAARICAAATTITGTSCCR
ncbi:retrovirus-related pol polyprotein from transposon TNT 1-94 [Tanacetum coccineum]